MRNIFTLLLLSPLLTACLGAIDMGPGVDKTSQGFSESMRWLDYPAAAAYLQPDVRGVFLEQFEEDDDLHLVSSSVTSINMHPDGDQADAVYVMEYYRLPSNQIKKWRWKQQWRLIQGSLAKQGIWLIENEPPVLPWKQ